MASRAKSNPCCVTSPLKFSARDWRDIGKNVWRETGRDNVAIIAAGVAFFTMLAIFPLITACLSIYGIFADPAVVETQLGSISSLLPPPAWAILDAQVTAVVNAPSRGLGWGIIIGLTIALLSAGSGIRAMMRAMNIAYGEDEKRNVALFYLLTTALTISVTFFMWASLGVIIGVPALLNFVHLEGIGRALARYMPWLLLVMLFAISTTTLYRIGPSRRPAKFRWIFPGVLFATISWMLVSTGFSHFVSEFNTYNKTYGGLSAAIILLVWFWLTALVVIIGAEINAELERHTSADTTRGDDRPIGERGAAMVDYTPPLFIP